MHHRQDAHQKGSDNSASARVSSQFQSRPFGLQAQSETATPQQQEIPDLQTQLERALRFGPDFSRVRVRAEGPPPTIQSKLFFGDHSDQEEPVTDAIAQPVTSMPAPRVNLRPIPRQDAESVGNQPNPLAARMMPPIQRRDAESVGNQPHPLAARMMPVVQRRDAESVGNQPNPLAARMMPVVQRQPQPIVSIQRQPWIQRIEQQPEANIEQEDESAPVQVKLENATVQRQSEANVEEEAEDSLPVQTQLENATVQRQSEGEQESEKEDPSMQLVQPKLTIGAPGDKYEIEADSMAERVMSMTEPANPAAMQRSEAGEEDALQRQPLADSITPLIQRQSEEGEDIQTKPSVQRAGGDGGVHASSSIENTLASQKGGGSPLDEEVRSFMEPRFGNDFSGVRIHTGSNAVQMNKELHAQAFTHGSDVYFNEGKYNPRSNEGKQLLAHELTHVVQQTGAVQPKSVTQWVKKGNKIQAKALSAVSSEAQPAIQLKENPQQQTEKDLKVQPAKPAQAAATVTESGQGGAKHQASAAKGATTAAKSQGQGNGGTAAEKQNVIKPAASGSASGSSAGGGGAKSLASLQDDPAFQAVVNKAKGVAQDKKKHDPAQAESKEAQDAAQPPANEVESKAQDKQVGEMNQQQPGEFNAEAFKAALMEKIAAVIPNNEEDAKKFKDSNQIDSVKQDMSSQVTQEQEQAAGPIEEKTQEAPNTSGIEPKPVNPLQPPEAGSQQTDIGAEKAAPKPKPESEVSQPLKANSLELDQQMAEAHLTEEQLEKSNEPQFQEALGAKKEAQANAVEAPQAYRQTEQTTLNKAQAEAQTTSQTQLEGMHGQREQLLAQVMGVQGETQGKDTQERAKIAKEINGIYEKTKGEVETVLNGIDGEVTSKFDAGAATAKQKFETYVGQKMEAWEQQRYGEWYDVTGWDERVSDAWNGLPPEVNQFFVDGRQLYLNSMDVTLTGIANFVAQKLNEAKQKIAEGKQKIQEYVAGLPENLKQVGQEAAQNIQEKFNQLEESVNNKQDELIDSLAQKYSENLQQIDAEIEKRKEENRGLKDKAKDAIAGTYQTIMQLKDMLMGVLAKAAGAINKIILDPIAFLGNLISGIKQGFDKFAGNIENHLQKGLLGWLTGAMAGAGITMPESFDLKGIFSLVMQVLGVVYEGIKSRVIKALGKNGEKMFNALESSFEMFVILKNEGVGGLWQFIQDKIGDLKVMVIDTIKTFVVENVIKAGVLWVVSLLNPASAFVKACKAIYDIIMFFIERGSQIAQLVNAVTDSVGAIASGAIGGAAALIENALGTSLPVVISFMASLLGLGGISEKIGGIIKQVRAPIDKAIDWLIAQAVKFAKKIGNKLGFGKDEKGKEDEVGEEGTITAADREKHEQYAQEIEQKLKEKNHQFKDFDSFHAAKQNEAENLREQYQKNLKKGIKLSIDFKAPEADKKDGDIDVEIKIAPNTTVRDIQIGGDGNQSLQERVALMEQKYENDYKGIKKENAEFEKYKHLETEIKQLKERVKVEDSPVLEKDIEKAEKKFIALKNILEIRKELDKISQEIGTDKVRMDAVIIYGDYNLTLKKLDGTGTEKIENKYTTISGQDEQVIKLEQHFKETKQRLLNEFEVLEIRDREVRQLEVNLDQKKDKDRPDPSHDAETKLLERIIEEIGRIVTPDNQIDQGKLQEAQKREKEIRGKFEETNNLRKQIEVNQQELQTALANPRYSSFEDLQEAYTALTKTLREEKRSPNGEESTIFKLYKTANGAKKQVASAQKKLEEMGGIMTVEEREQKIHEVYRDLNLEERTKLDTAIQEWEITGTININDEQAACSSCQGIIRALKSRFSNLKVNLVEVVKSYHGF